MTNEQSPRARDWARTLLVIGLVVLALGGAAATWAKIRADGSRTAYDVVFNLPGSTGQNAAAWSGEGRFAVVAYAGKGGVPGVAAWDRETDTARTVDGYQLLFVEPYASVAWLAPAGEDASEARSFDGFGDVIDHKPYRLMAWRLDDGSQPTDNVPSKWRAWPGPGERIAYLEISVLKGAAPSAVLFNNTKSQGEGVKAKLPEDITTFVPIGWSPSGRYFAVEQLLDEAVATKDYPSAELLPLRRVLVFDANSGEVSGSADLPQQQSTAPLALWAGAADEVLWPASATATDPAGVPVQLRRMTATGVMSASNLAEFAPDKVSALVPVRSFGWDVSGPVFSIDRALWQVKATGLRPLGGTNVEGAWSASGGLLGIKRHNGDATTWVELVLSDLEGRDARRVWRSPEVPIFSHGK